MSHKTLLTTTVAITLAALFYGCGQDAQNTQKQPTAAQIAFQQSSKVLSERDFATGNAVHANENHIVILSLEHPSAKTDANDTGVAGTDCFLFKPTKDLSNTVIAIDDDMPAAKVTIREVVTGAMKTAKKGDGNSTVHSFQAGHEYEYCVAHDGIKNEAQTTFVRFMTPAAQGRKLRASDANVQALHTSNKCQSCDFSNYDFTQSFTSLSNVDLSHANLSGATLPTTLDNSNFSGVDLTTTTTQYNSSMIGTILDNAAVVVSNSDGTFNYNNFHPFSIKNASFKGVNLTGFDFRYFSTNNMTLQGVNFTGVNLSNALFQQLTFQNCTFDSANLSGAQFANADLSANNSLVNANLTNAALNSANFNSAKMNGVNMTGATVALTTFVGAIMFVATLPSGIDLTGVGPIFSKPSQAACTAGGGSWDTYFNECTATWDKAMKICTLPTNEQWVALGSYAAGFTSSNNYWSSSESGSGNAWYAGFGSYGDYWDGINDKGNDNNVRCAH